MNMTTALLIVLPDDEDENLAMLCCHSKLPN